MYNDMYFQPRKFSVKISIKYEASNQVDSEALKLHQDKPKTTSTTQLFQESGNYIPLFEDTEIQSKCVSHNEILQSKDNFSLLKYIPQRDLQSRQYIVQVKLESTS